MDFRPALPVDPALDADRFARLDAQCALLERLSLRGMELVEVLVAQIKAPVTAPLAAPKFQGDVSLAYARVSRAIRLTVALQSKLLTEMFETQKARSDRRAIAAQAASEADPPERVEIAEPAETAERAEVREREREAPDEIDALLRLPTDEVIGIICRDLGVGPEWVAQATTRGLRAETDFDDEDDDFDRPLTVRRPPPRRPPERWPRPS